MAGRLAIEKEGEMVRPDLHEFNLGQRVSENERRQHFEAFLNICNLHEIPLVVIHPAYLKTNAHECILTEFCKNNDVTMFDAFTSLHPNSLGPSLLFYDNMHPNNKGHRRLGLDLAKFVLPLVSDSN